MPVFLVRKIWNSVRKSQGIFLGILLCHALWEPCSWNFFISFSQLHVLVTDLHSYPHGPYGLLKFEIGVLLLEAEPGHRIISSVVCGGPHH